jgi:serine/threonine protein kinase
MELVDGPTLADRLAQGPMPVAEALDVARQIADALEGAHEKGIIHRDLKPADVKVTPTGTRLMSVDVRTDPSLVVQAPCVLFAGRFHTSDGSYWSNYDVSRDGREFLMLEASDTSTPRLNVVLNWTDTLK